MASGRGNFLPECLGPVLSLLKKNEQEARIEAHMVCPVMTGQVQQEDLRNVCMIQIALWGQRSVCMGYRNSSCYTLCLYLRHCFYTLAVILHPDALSCSSFMNLRFINLRFNEADTNQHTIMLNCLLLIAKRLGNLDIGE